MTNNTNQKPKNGNGAVKPESKAVKQEQPSPAVQKASVDIFAKIKAKTGLSNEKVDAWQKNWFVMPATRKKYEHLKDAPQVAGEELFAMTNDIIDFIQRQPGGQSVVFKKLKEQGAEFLHNPKAYLQSKYQKGKSIFQSVAAHMKSKSEQAKAAAQAAQAKVQPTPAQAKAPEVKPAEQPKPAQAKPAVKPAPKPLKKVAAKPAKKATKKKGK